MRSFLRRREIHEVKGREQERNAVGGEKRPDEEGTAKSAGKPQDARPEPGRPSTPPSSQQETAALTQILRSAAFLGLGDILMRVRALHLHGYASGHVGWAAYERLARECKQAAEDELDAAQHSGGGALSSWPKVRRKEIACLGGGEEELQKAHDVLHSFDEEAAAVLSALIRDMGMEKAG